MYTMGYYSAINRNTFESVLMIWMNLDHIIQNEVSQKEKDKYHILTHIYMESRMMVLMNYKEQTNGHGERGGEGAMYVESNTETYIIMCKIDSQQGFVVCVRQLK